MTSIIHVAKSCMALLYLFTLLGLSASSSVQLNRPLENERLQCCNLVQYPSVFRNPNRKVCLQDMGRHSQNRVGRTNQYKLTSSGTTPAVWFGWYSNWLLRSFTGRTGISMQVNKGYFGECGIHSVCKHDGGMFYRNEFFILNKRNMWMWSGHWCLVANDRTIRTGWLLTAVCVW